MILISTVIISAIATLASSFPYMERGRREPSSRAMTWSGWMPGGGMTLFASSADDLWSQSGLQPPSTIWQDQDYSWKNLNDPIERKAFHENDASTTKPFDDVDEDNFKLPSRPFDDERERRRFNEKPNSHKPRRYDNDEDDRRYSGSNANASFNAWFPIMLGMYPPESSKSTRNHRYPSGEDDSKSLAAIANSVNHGRSGVASSHAVIYTGQPRYNNNHKSY